MPGVPETISIVSPVINDRIRRSHVGNFNRKKQDEHYIYVWIDIPAELYVVKQQNLKQDQQNEYQNQS